MCDYVMKLSNSNILYKDYVLCFNVNPRLAITLDFFQKVSII